jgi:uncharacterized membrane protein YqgA involved in biofilm formation
VLDGFASLAFASAMGIGVAFSTSRSWSCKGMAVLGALGAAS